MTSETGGGVHLRPIAAGDRDEFVAAARASAELHHPWVWAPTTAEGFAEYLARFDQVTAVGFVVCLADTGAMAGFVSISRIERGSYQKGVLGYGAFVPHEGRGHMTEGVGLAVRHGFGRLGLHRLEADIQPGNGASLRLAEKVGLRREGFSPGLIRIDGIWRDHERWAVTNEMVY
ncbi:GNAT family protein [Actinomadura viridis]|uniref:Ribosomal-protein-alanine N-acetyltransferase n=1 Tax=Actinomadura viridis TaxID=58110 RepID=A0A931GN59_9ACTN|nr:GNAT family N-acetyltransferase [Actinomadura viridis]MBG6092645.1 ribosomal-protein-alanine N-acetyltransferase [Actinomadura viridis]